MKKGLLALTSAVAGAAAGAAAVSATVIKSQGRGVRDVDKFKGYYHVLNKWLMLKLEGKSLEKYFIDNNYRSIAIYGMGELGNRLYEELKKTSIEVKYAVDQKLTGTYSELEVLDKNSEFAKVDAIIVTANFAYDEIKEELSAKIDFPIISIDDVVYEI